MIGAHNLVDSHAFAKMRETPCGDGICCIEHNPLL